RFDAEHGELQIVHHDNVFPLAPTDYAAVLETAGSPRLKDVIAAFAAIDPAQEDKDGRADSARAQLRALAADPEALADIDAALAA
ncbi:hypothetical protein ACP3WJ_23840, partial [Salmonella enterica]